MEKEESSNHKKQFGCKRIEYTDDTSNQKLDEILESNLNVQNIVYMDILSSKQKNITVNQ